MAQRNETRQRAVFLPEGVQEFMRRRAVESLGLCLLALAGALAAALASYNPADPSWSTATGAAPTNWLGPPGAHAADLILQTSGLAGVLPALGVPVAAIQSTYLDVNRVRRPLRPDQSIPWLDLLREKVPDARVELVPHVGHFPMLEALHFLGVS